MVRRIVAMVLAVGLTSLIGVGCSGTDTGDEGVSTDGQPRTAGLQLTSDALGNTDIGGMQFTVENCGGGVVDTATKDFEEMFLPGGISALEREPFDEGSEHIFADHYFLLAAGCYDVIAQPLQADGTPSADCDSARRDNVSVEDGETTEILLISQCKGPEKGGLDVLGSVNHPPEIEDVTFQPSKFISDCERSAPDFCVTVSDPDGDPLELVLESTQSGDQVGAVTETSRTKVDATTTRICGSVELDAAGKYGWRLTAYDQAYDDQGNLDRIENIIAGECQADNTTCESRDVINAWVYNGQDCVADGPTPTRGRSAVVMMAMNNSPGPVDNSYAVPLIRQVASWAAPDIGVPSNQGRILYILDDNHQGEHGVNGLADGPDGDAKFVTDALIDEFGLNNVKWIDEPADGITREDIEAPFGAAPDLIWFANPGHELDDDGVTTRIVLRRYRDRGGGLVLQGDDMAGGDQTGPDMTGLTLLNEVNNGEMTCGEVTDDNAGANYTVNFDTEPSPVLDGSLADLRGQTFSYGNDIDHSRRRFAGERVLASATFQNENCPEGVSYPVVVTIDPRDLPLGQ